MANILYTRFLAGLASGATDWDSSVFRALLVRSTSTYVPDKDHDYMSDTTGLVEISVSGYSRQTLANATVTVDDVNDKVLLSCSDINFGNLAAGQTVKAILIYQRVGPDDSTPNDDPLVAYIDTMAQPPYLPIDTAGGAFILNVSGAGSLIQLS